MRVTGMLILLYYTKNGFGRIILKVQLTSKSRLIFTSSKSRYLATGYHEISTQWA